MKVPQILMILFLSPLATPALALEGDAYVNPYLFGTQSFNLGVDVKVADKLTIGPYGAYGWSDDDQGHSTHVGYGARLDWFLTGTALSNSWYLSPFFSRYDFETEFGESEGADDSFKAGRSEFWARNLGLTGGYGFYSDRDDGLNFFVRVGLGMMHTAFGGDITAERTDGTAEKVNIARLSGWLPTGDIHVGLRF